MTNPMSKLEVLDKWIAALRSGEFRQGFNCLKTENNEYCCLGVLCEITKDITGGEFIEHVDEDFRQIEFGTGPKDYDHEMPPHVVSELVGLTTDDEIYLSQLNDKEKKSFNQIADYLDTEYRDTLKD